MQVQFLPLGRLLAPMEIVMVRLPLVPSDLVCHLKRDPVDGLQVSNEILDGALHPAPVTVLGTPQRYRLARHGHHVVRGCCPRVNGLFQHGQFDRG
jgi:hypothetical protein